MTDEISGQDSANQLESSLEKYGYLIRPIRGISMLPLLEQEKDAVKIVPVKEQPLKKYDVPLYKRPNGSYVLHRILSVKEGYYVICGDNLFRKEKVPFEWVFGVMEGFFKSGKYVPCTDEQYLKYAKKAARQRPYREIKNLWQRVLRKMKKIIKR